jgi:hypothetical protein
MPSQVSVRQNRKLYQSAPPKQDKTVSPVADQSKSAVNDNYRFAIYEAASPSLLAQTPNSIGPASANTQEGWTDLWQHLERRLVGMRNWRISWWEHWALLAIYILPRRYKWLVTANTMTRGLPINQNIVDSTGTLAMRTCAAGLMSGLTSPSRPWFKLNAKMPPGEDEPKDGREWLDTCESVIYDIMQGSNYYDSVAQQDEDLVVFGTAPKIIYEDPKDVIRCYNPCAGEYFLAVGPDQRVESFYRTFTMTIAQIVEMFGLENCSADVRGMWETKGASLETERIVAHAIEPNFPVGGKQLGIVPSGFPFREVYWLWGNATPQPLSVRGFNESPISSPRWAITANDPYGRSPAMDALPDVMQLQVETKRKAEAIEKQVRPPLMADVQLKNQPSSILPGNVTYVANIATGGMKPIYEVKPDLQYMTLDIAAIQERIKKCFFNDLFQMLSMAANKNMTAYEVAQLQQEKLQVLGPVIERQQNENLSSDIKRIFSIAARRGLLPPMPKSMQNVPVSIQYISMLALAQKAAATAGMERYLSMAGNMANAYPAVLDIINPDSYLEEYGTLLTVPAKINRSADEIKKMRAARAEKQAQAEQMAVTGAALEGGVAATQAAKNLGQTPVGGGMNAIQAMLGA